MTKGALYVLASGNKPGEYWEDLDITEGYYYNLVVNSVKSLKKQMPELPVTVFTNYSNVENELFDEVRMVRDSEVWLMKYRAVLDTPYDLTVHMDADTYVCAPFWEVFDTVDERFDVAATMSVNWRSARYKNLAPCYPEPAFGVFWWRRSDRMTSLFEQIYKMMETRTGGCDEPFVRVALYQRPDVQFYILPWEYNCLYTHPCYLFSQVKVLHGHGAEMERDAEVINTRVYKDYLPYKRLLTGKEVWFYKKRRQKIMGIVGKIQYQGLQGEDIRA